MGPGHPDYLTSQAKHALQEAEILIGAERHLSAYRDLFGMQSGVEKELIPLRGKFRDTLKTIHAKRKKGKVAVLVSGDPCLYSYLKLIASRFSKDDFTVIPGISSLQLALACLGMSAQDVRVMSLHGRSPEDFRAVLGDETPVVVFTDREHNPAWIGEELKAAGLGSRRLWIGERLSYPDERIRIISASEAACETVTYKEKEGLLCLVVIL